MEHNPHTFGSRLRELRLARQITPRDFAARVRLSETYLEKLERDYNPPPAPATILDIARALRTDADELFALAGKLPPDIENSLVGAPLLVQLVRVGLLWPKDDLKRFLAAQGVAAGALEWASCPNPREKSLERRSGRERITAELRRAVFSRDDNECVYCSSRTLLEVDHIYPHSLGGTNEIENLVTCCARCNGKKGNREKPFVMVFGRFRNEMEQLLK